LEKTLSLSLRWSVQAVIMSKHFSIKKRSRKQKGMAPEGRIVVYREYFQRLLKTSMPLRDRLVIELPCFEGLRSGEVSSLRAEWVDIENGDIKVLDSKKHTMFTLPLDPTVAKHIIQLNIHEGFLIRALPHARRQSGVGLSVTHIDRIWADQCKKADVPVMPARMGRCYFACQWHFVERKSMFHLMAMLRHDSLQSTEHYLSKLVDYEDLKAEFQQGRMFQPQIKEEPTWNKK